MTAPAVIDRTAILAELEDIGRRADDAIPLGRAALLLAALDHPERSVDPYLGHLDALAHDVRRARITYEDDNGLAGKAAILARVLADEYGYGGDRVGYDNLQNANLMDVIDRRRGLPVALGVVYLSVARAQGWPCAGLSFPSHFLIQLEDRLTRVVIDPFNGGRTLASIDLVELVQGLGGPAAQLSVEMLLPANNRRILLRLLNNVVERLMKTRAYDRAASALERMLMIAPDDATLWYELGETQSKAGNLGAAMRAIERCLATRPDGTTEHDAALALHHLKRRLN